MSRISDRAAAVISFCESRKYVLIVSFSMLYWIAALLASAHRLLWFDELFTFYLSRLTPAEMWHELARHTDWNPPFFYLLTKAAGQFGTELVSTRLPAITGTWVMSLCLFRFVHRRYPAGYAFMAMLFPMTTVAYTIYSIEARPYGFMLGCCAVALLCWQAAAEQVRRSWALVGLALSLATAISVHYYGVLMLFPLAAGELARSLVRKRVDLAIWTALVSSLVPMLIILPVIPLSATKFYPAHAIPHAPYVWANAGASFSDIDVFYDFLLEEMFLGIVLMISVIVIGRLLEKQQARAEAPRSDIALKLHESVAVACVAIYPCFVFLIGRYVTATFVDRYALPSILGLSVLVPAASYAATDGRRWTRISLLLIVAAFAARNMGRQLMSSRTDPWSFERSANRILFHSAPDQPIVVADPMLYLETCHSWPALAPKLHYITGIHLAGAEVELMKIRPLAGINLQPFDAFVSKSPSFRLYCNRAFGFDWLNQLDEKGFQHHLLASEGENLLFQVEPRNPSEYPPSRTP